MFELVNVNKSYHKKKIINDVSIRLNEKKILGIAGPDGAGKTILLRIACGLIRPDQGNVYLDEELIQNIDKLTLARQIGYVPQNFGKYGRLRTYEYLEYYAALYKIAIENSRLEELLQFAQMKEYADVYVEELSKILQRKLNIIRCFVYEPKYLLIDEPFTGLDTMSKIKLQSFIVSLKEQGKGILITSHMLQDVTKIADTIGIMNQGKLLATGTAEDLIHIKNQFNPLKIKVLEDIAKAVEVLQKNPKVTSIAKKKEEISITFTGNEIDEAELLASLMKQDIRVNAFYREESDFESLYLSITQSGEESENEV